MEKIIENNY